MKNKTNEELQALSRKPPQVTKRHLKCSLPVCRTLYLICPCECLVHLQTQRTPRRTFCWKWLRTCPHSEGKALSRRGYRNDPGGVPSAAIARAQKNGRVSGTILRRIRQRQMQLQRQGELCDTKPSDQPVAARLCARCKNSHTDHGGCKKCNGGDWRFIAGLFLL